MLKSWGYVYRNQIKKKTSVETEVEPKLTAYEKDLIYSKT